MGTAEQMQQFIGVYKRTILQAKQKYVLLDRDGTLIFEPQDTYQIDSLAKLSLLDGAITGLQELQARGYKFVLISNQDGLGTPAFPRADFEAPQTAMLKAFDEAGITFEQVFICPHLPVDDCECRKPKTRLVDDWLQDVEVDLDKQQSFVCGDRKTDKAFADNIGLPFVPMKTNGNFNEAVTAYLERSVT
jgi:imidazoleglycerol-phosphate dehydratase/histidinol-phosphatase